MSDGGVIVTGASRGIGLAIARVLVAEGRPLLLVARDEARLKQAAQFCPGAEALALDLTEPDAGERVLERAVALFGAPFGLVNNAGIAESAPLAKTDDALLARHFELNFLSPMRLMRASIPVMARAGRGRVVNICSTAALAGYPYVSAYAASKHALLGATRSLAREFAQKGVTVNAVCPGYVRTEMFQETVANIAARSGLDEAAAEARLCGLSPQGRVFEPEEVAATVCFLLSEGALGINGQALSLDGGEIEH